MPLKQLSMRRKTALQQSRLRLPLLSCGMRQPYNKLFRLLLRRTPLVVLR
jgi:hypothetical protein